MMIAIFCALCFGLCLISHGFSSEVVSVLNYDVVIGGGSLSALAAALSLANLSRVHDVPLTIALLEPTDWPGGQLTSSNVPPDFGQENFDPTNLPASFVNLLMNVAGPTWWSNPGLCWVSYKCFEANHAAEFIKEWLVEFAPSLTVFYNTTVKTARTASGKVVELTAIMRTPRASIDEYSILLSDVLEDWYSPKDSDRFDKRILRFRNPQVVIEGTEFADILMTSGIKGVSQGTESPTESSVQTDSHCGQSTVFPFHMSFRPNYTKSGDIFPPGNDGGYAYSLQGLSWEQVWTYRRVVGQGDADWMHVFPGETSNQNLDNDFAGGYLFLDLAVSRLEAQSDWYGGINMTVLRAAEQRAFGW